METTETIRAIVIRCIDALNKQLPPEEKITAEEETILVGDGGRLDSLALITLMVSLEDALAEKGITIGLVDGMMDEGNAAHYQTVACLTSWIAGQAIR